MSNGSSTARNWSANFGADERIPCDELLAKLEEQGVPAGPINDVEQVFDDPQVIFAA